MSDLVAWLTKILDEDEAAAEGNGTIAWLTFRDPDGQMQYTAVACGEPDDHWVVDGKERTDYASVQVVLNEHQVLADIEAKRKIVDYMQRQILDATEYYETDAKEATLSATCANRVLRALASAYADRPGYDDNWKP